jgi:hypothetical protein
MVAIYANSFSNLVAMLNRYLVILLLSIGYCFQSKATHIVGGEMSYKYLGDNKYEVTLVMYRDCGPDNTRGTGFDSYAAIGVIKSMFSYSRRNLH